MHQSLLYCENNSNKNWFSCPNIFPKSFISDVINDFNCTNFLLPMISYMIVATLLTIIAIFSVFDAGKIMVQMISSQDFATGLTNVLMALLLTITIIILSETVAVYFRTKHVEVRAFLVAGLTGLVRHVFIYNVSGGPIQMFATLALLAVLIVGISFVKPEEIR
jgi:uncharacterized membrane protein (DUF373 family)